MTIESSVPGFVWCPLYTIALVSLLLSIDLASRSTLAQQRVGIDSAVNPSALGTAPGGLPRRLVLGQAVVFDERITTEAQGQTQILFVDESTLSIGPNANLVIDQFVYDPNAGTGRLAASLTRGVFRFVGGKLSKQDNAVTMRTPTATIGIRGGVMLVDLAPDGKLSIIFVFGKGVTVTGLDGTSRTITRPGFEVTVSGPGASPSDPAPAPPGAATALLAQLDGRPGGNGGASTIPTEGMVTNSGIANVSATVADNIQAAAQTQVSAAQPQNGSAVVQLTQLNIQDVSAQSATLTGVPSVTNPVVQLTQSAQGATLTGAPSVTGGSNTSMNPQMPSPIVTNTSPTNMGTTGGGTVGGPAPPRRSTRSTSPTLPAATPAPTARAPPSGLSARCRPIAARASSMACSAAPVASAFRWPPAARCSAPRAPARRARWVR